MTLLASILKDGEDVDMPALRNWLATVGAQASEASLVVVTAVLGALVGDRVFDTVAALPNAPAAGLYALVTLDPDETKIGLWKKTGAAGSSGWTGPSLALRGPGLTSEQSISIMAAIQAGAPVKPRSVTAIFQETVPSAVKRITAQSYFPIGTAGTDPRYLGDGEWVQVPTGPQEIWRTPDAAGGWWELKKTPIMQFEQFGIKGGATFGSAPDETALINGVLDRFAPIGQVFYLNRIYKIFGYGAMKNLRGCRFVGPGDIVYPVAADPSGPSEFSGFASAIFDDDDKLESSGEEYLVHNRLRLNGGAPIRAVVFADSRWAGDGNYNGVLFDKNNFIQFAFPQIAEDIGLPGAITVNNLAVPGTTLEDAWNGNTADGMPYSEATNGTTPFGAANSGNYDWIIVGGPGINDFKDMANDTNRPVTVEQRVDQRLALYDGYFSYLRQNHDVKDLAITVFGPTSANHIRYQTTDAIKRFIIGLRRLCRLYQVHYVDLYSRWSDSIHMAHRTLDGAFYPSDWPYVPHRGQASHGPLHNLDVQQAAVFGMLRDHMRRWYVTAEITNRFVNPSFTTKTVEASAPPSTYAKGLSGHEVSSEDGWPTFGYVSTFISGSSDRGVQTLYSDGEYPTEIYRRVAVSNADDWLPWIPIGGPALAHSGAWNFNGVTGVAVPVDPDVINGVMGLGQSTEEGNTGQPQALWAGAPLNSTVAPYVLMGDCGARFNLRVYNADKPQPTGPIFAEFVPCHEAIDFTTQCYETPLTSTLTHIHQMIFDATGVRTTWAGVTLARGGYKAEQLKQGRGAFEYSRQWLKDAVAAATKAGKKFVLRDIFWRSNESDTTVGTPATTLRDLLVELASAYNALAKGITGQTEDIRFWLDAPQDPRCKIARRHSVLEAQRMADEKSPLIRLSAPYYQHQRSTAAGEQKVHLTSRGTNNSGVDRARQVVDTLIGDFAPAEPIAAWVSNVARTEITLEFPDVPGLDATGIITLAGIPGHGGIVLEDVNGVTIVSASVTGPDAGYQHLLKLTTSAPISHGSRVLIGLLPNATEDPISGNVFGPETGARTAYCLPSKDIINLFTGDTVRSFIRPWARSLS